MMLNQTNLDCEKDCVIPFGACAQANCENNPTDANEARTSDPICLRPTDNTQGGHEVMDLNSGRTVARRKVTEIPITDSVTKAVEKMAFKQGFKDLKFKNGNEVAFRDNDWIAGVDCEEENKETEEDEQQDEIASTMRKKQQKSAKTSLTIAMKTLTKVRSMNCQKKDKKTPITISIKTIKRNRTKMLHNNEKMPLKQAKKKTHKQQVRKQDN